MSSIEQITRNELELVKEVSEKRLLTLQEVLIMLNMSQSSFRRHCFGENNEYDFPLPVNLIGYNRFFADEVEQWFEDLRKKSRTH
jgi:predicted DNA-binding transcriptional regulator AlpA